MSNKILMAEGLDLIRDAEAREYDCDKRHEAIKEKLRKMKGELGKLVHDYELIYRQYIQGLEVLNYVRHRVMDGLVAANASQSKQVADFCAAKMTYYMDRCEGLKKKLSKIFIPLSLMAVPMNNFTAGSQLMREDSITLKGEKSIFERQFNLERGTYVLTVCYLSDYNVVSPDLNVTVIVDPHNAGSIRWERSTTTVEVPCSMGWRHIIGITGGNVTVRITTKGVREIELSTALTQWSSAVNHLTMEDAKTVARKGARAAPSAPAAESSSTSALKRLAVNPRGMTCGARLDLFDLAVDSWPQDNILVAALQREPQMFIQNLFSLPMPTELN